MNKYFKFLNILLLVMALDGVVAAQKQLNSVSGFSHLVFMNELTPDQMEEYVDGNFGRAISVSNNRVLVASLIDESSNASVFLFEYVDNHWIQAHEFILPNNHYGTDVSIDADRVVIGADSGDGAVYVYEKINNEWTFIQTLVPSDVAPTHGDKLGHQVKIVGDRILISSLYGPGLGANSGAVYTFDFNGVNWVETQKIFASDGLNEDKYGSSLDFNEDWAFVGANSYGENRPGGNGENSGAVYVYKNDNGNWVEVAKLTASDGEAFERFGASVSVSGDWAVIGASGAYWTSITGYAYAFKYNENTDTWEEKQKILASDGEPADVFGHSVSVNGDLCLIGAIGPIFFTEITGYAYQFKFNEETDTWQEIQKIIPNGDSEQRYFGYDVALSDQFSVISNFSEDAIKVYRSDGIFTHSFE